LFLDCLPLFVAFSSLLNPSGWPTYSLLHSLNPPFIIFTQSSRGER
jgi:hypothetical protein